MSKDIWNGQSFLEILFIQYDKQDINSFPCSKVIKETYNHIYYNATGCISSQLASKVTFFDSIVIAELLHVSFICSILLTFCLLLGIKRFNNVFRNVLPVIDRIIRFNDALSPCKKWFNDIIVDIQVGI